MNEPIARRPRVSGALPALTVLAAGMVFIHAFVAAVVLASVASGKALGDWVSIYAAATIVREGGAAQLYEASAQEAVQVSIFGPDAVLNFFPQPAFFAVVISPIARMSFTESYFVWLLLNVVLAGVLLVGGHKTLTAAGAKARWWVVAAAGLSLPLLNLLLLGQVDLLILLSFAASFWLFRSGRPVPAGAALALALIKPHLAIGVVLLLFVKRDWGALAGFAAVGAPLLLFPALLYGPEIVWEQASAALGTSGATTEGRINAGMMVNVRGTLTSITGSSSPAIWLVPTVIVAAGALTLALRAWRTASATDPRAWAVAIALPLLMSPHLHEHSLVLLVAACVLYAAADAIDGRDAVQAEHALIIFIALTALWVIALLGVSLTSLLVIALFVAMTSPRKRVESVNERRQLPEAAEGLRGAA